MHLYQCLQVLSRDQSDGGISVPLTRRSLRFPFQIQIQQSNQLRPGKGTKVTSSLAHAWTAPMPRSGRVEFYRRASSSTWTLKGRATSQRLLSFIMTSFRTLRPPSTSSCTGSGQVPNSSMIRFRAGVEPSNGTGCEWWKPMLTR
jgi:hypothetical protein